MARTRKSDGLSIDWSEKGGFPIRISEDLFDVGNTTVIETLREVTGAEKPRVMLVADSNVVQRTEGLGTRIGKYVQEHGLVLAGAPVVLGGGEKIKVDNYQSVLRVMTAAFEAGIGASDAMMVIGGGSILDVAGVAAAQIRGGVRLVRVPTTVAAMVDAGVSETAAINGLGQPQKDALRVTSRPAAVLIDPLFARTVLDGVWRGGIGSVIRQAAVLDGPLMKRLAKNAEALRTRDVAKLTEIVTDILSARAKKGATDFALWSALRLETMSGFKLPHGYSVPIGICIDCGYAVKKGLLKESDQELVCKALSECGALDGLLHSQHLLSQTDGILEGLDAWRQATGREAVTLLTAPGKTVVEEAPDRELYRQVIKDFFTAATSA